MKSDLYVNKYCVFEQDEHSKNMSKLKLKLFKEVQMPWT
jgi:hypothetical protein